MLSLWFTKKDWKQINEREFWLSFSEYPVKEFLDSLDDKMRAKFLMEIKLLEEKDNQLREPYHKPLGDGIFELRAKVGTDISRVLYFVYSKLKIIKETCFWIGNAIKN